MNRKTADKLLAQTRENYNSFAKDFSQTRNYLWPEMKSLASDYSKAGDKVLDIGCGNGRFYPFFQEKGVKYVGIDNSKELVAIAREKFPKVDFIVGDALCLPFAENEFDVAVAFAVLHHIPSRDYRAKFFSEARRVLKPGGILIVTVWDLRLFSMARLKQWKRLKNFIKSQIKIALGLEKFDFGDFFIPWQNKYPRYVHSFSFGELRSLAADSGFAIERSGTARSGSKEGNLYIIAKKLQNK